VFSTGDKRKPKGGQGEATPKVVEKGFLKEAAR
jgi:hypothetical protein